MELIEEFRLNSKPLTDICKLKDLSDKWKA